MERSPPPVPDDKKPFLRSAMNVSVSERTPASTSQQPFHSLPSPRLNFLLFFEIVGDHPSSVGLLRETW